MPETTNDSILSKGKNSFVIWAAFAAGICIMFCLAMAWQHFFAPVEIPQDAKYIRERAALEAEAAQLRAANVAMADTNAMLLDSITVLLQKPTEIHQNHETLRQNNWALDDSAAAALLRTRLAAEDTHRQRFVYRTYPN